MVIAGILVSLLLHAIKPNTDSNHNRFYDFLTSIIITILVWEGNLRIDTWMNKHYPWVGNTAKRLVIHASVSLVYSVLSIYLTMLFFNAYVCNIPEDRKEGLMLLCVIIGLLVTVLILAIEISSQFFYQWKQSLIEVEKYKTESTQAQLQNLKDQINPHFLFNNMSVLSSLVYKDQDKAVDFINQLSKVYRYLLDTNNSELVTLETELTFIKSYTYLLQIRFDTNIQFQFTIDNKCQHCLLPPMALQLLIENAIKHNEVSTEQPLSISIVAQENVLMVSNNLQLRTVSEPGSNTGLHNIKERYKHYSNRTVEVQQINTEFIVTLPLLAAK
jgi:hypothetical protein